MFDLACVILLQFVWLIIQIIVICYNMRQECNHESTILEFQETLDDQYVQGRSQQLHQRDYLKHVASVPFCT